LSASRNLILQALDESCLNINENLGEDIILDVDYPVLKHSDTKQRITAAYVNIDNFY